MTYFPAAGTNAERTTDVVRIGRGVIYVPKIVPGPKWWKPLMHTSMYPDTNPNLRRP
jgi:hypothetical protein